MYTSAYAAGVLLTRPNNTDAYNAGDVIGAATDATAALTFVGIGPAQGEVVLMSTTLEVDVSSVPAGMTSFTLYLYSVTPPSAIADNAAFDLPSGDRAYFLGALALGTPADIGSTLFIEVNGINKQITMPGTTSGAIFGYLVTAGGFTPAANTVFRIGLHSKMP